ncbi:MAG: deoxyguanosinetriphosphate triphosphohydrolase [Anaerolinea sp.]|nr:deoxyguanosinetriphosphate triphosphohydrolase [Anaerolinea sp.]MCC6976552.1 deoxyguanosinetriphosphate triphosphohydrolase [Anaerolineae bacterium]CAG0993004.1 dGTPase [Anaerolineae bacterium]
MTFKRITRQVLEAHEAQILAPYGIKSGESQGRRHPEQEDPNRTAFQRDRDRILHTTAFRRLEYKTQVFVNYEGDYYRTRLTHTLEVAQIGRTLARALGANEDLVEGICLSHDLGHSPFGHAGEDILNELMHDHGGFNHNLQTYRIVTELEQRYPGWHGLNLTFELLEGIAKHETDYDQSDNADFDPALRGSLEAQIANMADELAYNAHDLDDGLRAGMIQIEQTRDLKIWSVIGNHVDLSRFDDVSRHGLHRRLINTLIDDLITTTGTALAKAGVKSPREVQMLPNQITGYSPEVDAMNRELKQFLYANLYNHYRVVRMSVKAKRFIREMFECYLNDPRQLPSEVQAQIESKGLHRVIADYIAGMTDRYALQEWERLYLPFTRT